MPSMSPSSLRSGWQWLMTPRGRFGDLDRLYPNRLAAAEPERPKLSPALPWVAVLLAACLILRAVMATRAEAICPDGAIYIQQARALEQGDWTSGFQTMGINIYPVILLGLHKLGLDWELAGKLWGVAMASLVVLPLFGWVRRQFDDRVAALACLLYAFNPKAIEWSPDLIREPTFWFLFALSLYLMWRAVTEVRLWLFAAAGMTTVLATLTRFEAVFLIYPIILWSAMRFRALEQQRGQVVAGMLLAVSIAPLLLVALNITLLANHGRWEMFGLAPLERVEQCLRAVVDYVSGSGSGGTWERAIAPGAVTLGPAALTWAFLDVMQRGLSPLYGLLMFGGVAYGWKVWSRADQRPMFCIGLSVAGGILVHLWYTGQTSSRYPLSIVILGTPYAALGLYVLGRWLVRRFEQGTPVPQLQAAGVTLALGVLALVGTADALTHSYQVRADRAAVGRWIREQYGPESFIMGSLDLASQIAYYSDGHVYCLTHTPPEEPLVEVVEKWQPLVIVLSAKHVPQHDLEQLVAEHDRLGVAPIEDEELASVRGKIVVMARTGMTSGMTH